MYNPASTVRDAEDYITAACKHRHPDVTFKEDAERKYRGHAAENFSRLNCIALNLVNYKPAGVNMSKKLSVEGQISTGSACY